MKNMLLLLLFVLPTALFSASPSCVAGMEVSVVNTKGKVIKKGKLNRQGKLTLSGVKDANWDIKLTNNGKSILLGVNKKKKIDKSSPLLFRAKTSDYQDGDDLLLRKRPGRTSSKDGGSSGLATGKRGASADANHNTTRTKSTRATDYNSSRSNKNGRSNALDDDDDGDGLSTEMSRNGLDQDCDGADISVKANGKGKIEVHVTVLK